MTTEHYDVIIIGTGAGGGTLAHKLAPSGKRILLLERGGYLPRARTRPSRLAPGRSRTRRCRTSRASRPQYPARSVLEITRSGVIRTSSSPGTAFRRPNSPARSAPI